jgi:hypothetical protein
MLWGQMQVCLGDSLGVHQPICLAAGIAELLEAISKALSLVSDDAPPACVMACTMLSRPSLSLRLQSTVW